MKKIIYFLVFVVLFSSCESNVVVSKKVDKVLETKAINTVLDGWHTSATEANFETYFESMSMKLFLLVQMLQKIGNYQHLKTSVNLISTKEKLGILNPLAVMFMFIKMEILLGLMNC